MKNIYNLKDWQLDKSVSNAKRFVDVSIHLKYPDLKQFVAFKPKERIKKIDLDHKTNFKSLLALNLFDKHELTGTKKRPQVVKTKIMFSALNVLNKLDYISSVFIESIDSATQIAKKETQVEKYFCVKMTVVIEFERIKSKKQKIEKRFVLIKAKSHEDAYEKLDKQKEAYTVSYLNSDGRFVRWRIESFDDSYETDILNVNDLNNPEGVEIYSKFGSRKSNPKVVWDGKF